MQRQPSDLGNLGTVVSGPESTATNSDIFRYEMHANRSHLDTPLTSAVSERESTFGPIGSAVPHNCIHRTQQPIVPGASGVTYPTEVVLYGSREQGPRYRAVARNLHQYANELEQFDLHNHYIANEIRTFGSQLTNVAMLMDVRDTIKVGTLPQNSHHQYTYASPYVRQVNPASYEGTRPILEPELVATDYTTNTSTEHQL